MGQIYYDAYLTIIAACSSHGNAGILQDRQIPSYYAKHPSLPYYCSDGRLGTVSVYTEGVTYNAPKPEAVDYRAWCLQERLLSPRKLVYATNLVEYHCQTVTVPINNSIRWLGVVRLNNLLFGRNDEEKRNYG